MKSEFVCHSEDAKIFANLQLLWFWGIFIKDRPTWPFLTNQVFLRHVNHSWERQIFFEKKSQTKCLSNLKLETDGPINLPRTWRKLKQDEGDNETRKRFFASKFFALSKPLAIPINQKGFQSVEFLLKICKFPRMNQVLIATISVSNVFKLFIDASSKIYCQNNKPASEWKFTQLWGQSTSWVTKRRFISRVTTIYD